VDTLHDHAALELDEHPRHLEQRAAAWGAGIHGLLIEVQVDRFGVEFVESPIHISAICRPGNLLGVLRGRYE
jgi:hypothetical protein